MDAGKCSLFDLFTHNILTRTEPTTRKAREELARHRMAHIWDTEDWDQPDGTDLVRVLNTVWGGREKPSVQDEEKAAKS